MQIPTKSFPIHQASFRPMLHSLGPDSVCDNPWNESLYFVEAG
jgi:hypothetical protein